MNTNFLTNGLRRRGFTLIELLLVILVVAILGVVALPKFADLSRDAKVAVIRQVEGTMRSTIAIVKTKAIAQGLRPAAANPGGNAQTEFVVETEAGSAEVDWRNLCPESRAEVADKLTMLDFLSMEGDNPGGLLTRVDNRNTRVGYAFSGSERCFVIYDSFACTVSLVDSGC